MPLDFETARHVMVEQQVRPFEVLDPRVLSTIARLRREDFVAPKHRKLAYTDLELPLEHGETMFKPVLEGRLLQALELEPEHEVLEIGTGSGYVTACLADLARSVVSIDLHQDFIDRAQLRLEQAALSNVNLHCADALSYTPNRQFDAVAITAAVAVIPSRFLEWVRPGGRLFVVRGLSPVQEAVVLTRLDDSNGWREESLFETDVAYLKGAEPTPRFVF